MPDFTRYVAVAVVAAVVAALAGCARNPPTNFYVLSSLSGTSQDSDSAGVGSSGVTIGIGPVTLPGYIDRDGIVTRDGRNVLDVADLDQWAEPLTDNFSQVLGENLALLVPSDNVVYYPWQQATDVNYQIVVDVSRFEADSVGNGVLIAQWTIVTGDGEDELLVRKSQFVEPTAGSDVRAKVAALNLALERLSREMATAIRRLAG